MDAVKIDWEGETLCKVCGFEIVKREPWVRCVECAEGTFICKVCFGNGSESGDHKKGHSYQVMPSPYLAPLDAAWTAEEELRLLDAVEKHGLGNWEAVAEELFCFEKTASVCENHYIETFVLAPELGLVSEEDIRLVTESKKAQEKKDKVLQSRLANLIHMPGAEIAGYMPLRDCYDTEFLDSAESLLTDIFFSKEETESIQEQRHIRRATEKLEVVDGYNSVLNERSRRKKFVKDRKLLSWRDSQRKWKQMSPLEREIREELRPLERYSTMAEHDRLVNGLIRERLLEQRIQKLRHGNSIVHKTTDTVSPAQLQIENDHISSAMLDMTFEQYKSLKNAALAEFQSDENPPAFVKLGVRRTGRNFSVTVAAW